MVTVADALKGIRNYTVIAETNVPTVEESMTKLNQLIDTLE